MKPEPTTAKTARAARAVEAIGGTTRAGVAARHAGTRTWVMTITPFDAAEALDESALRAHLRWLAEAGIGVFLGSYGSGEGRLLRRDEVRRLYQIGVEELAGKVPFCAAALGLSSTDQVVELAREAHALGVEAVQIHPPLAGPPTIPPRPGEIDRFYRDVFDALDGPAVVSNEVLMVGYAIEPERMAALAAEHANVVGINWTDSNPASLAQLMGIVGERVPVRVGLTAQLPLALSLGAQGTVSFEANVAPALCRAVTDAFERRDTHAYHSAYRRLCELNLLLARYMTPRSVKAALAHIGRAGTTLRRPYLPLASQERADLARELDALDLEPGLQSALEERR